MKFDYSNMAVKDKGIIFHRILRDGLYNVQPPMFSGSKLIEQKGMT